MPNGDNQWKVVSEKPASSGWQVVSESPSKGSPITDKSSISPSSQNSIVKFHPEALAGPFFGSASPVEIDTTGIENYTQQGRSEHPVLSRVGDATRGLKELLQGGQSAGKPMGTSSGVANNPVTMAMSIAPGMAEAAPKLAAAIKPGESLARINKILGVTPKAIRVGELPEALDELASNPARGVMKAGFNEKELAKMNPIDRLQSLTKVRNEAGAKLDQVLQAAGDKTINVQKVVEDVFSQIPDPKMIENATTRVQQLRQKVGILNKPLSQLTPMEARSLQRALDEFADFSSEGATKTFRQVATSLRRGISQATRQAIPETAELDQDYGDLAGATKAARNQVKKYATTVPKGKLEKMIPYLIGGGLSGLGLGGGYEIAKHLLPQSMP